VTSKTTAGAWWQRAVFYQIYPSSFADSNGDGIGDLPGITGHLDHLAGSDHSLGVDAIWLSPFYRSPMVDFGYDVADHCDVDPRFGTLGDFDALLARAHARGLRVVVDLVPNHTSDQHPWFVESRSSRSNPRRDWYVWADPRPDGAPPNNWLSAFARVGAAWTLDPTTGQYYLHSYTAAQPDLNWRNPQVQAAMQQVMRFWLDRGVDGFRIDAPHRLIKDRDLRDNPPEVASLRLAMQLDERQHRNIDHPDVHEVLRGLRRTVDAYPDRVLIGEAGIRHPPRLARYYGTAHDELHLLFNFAFWNCPWSARCFREVVEQTETTLAPHGWPTYALSNHDLPRAACRYDQDGHGPARARLAAMLLLTLRGTPFLYYGEEIGMTDQPVPVEQAHDPDWRDPCRTPMQWSAGPGAGFTTGRPWLPIPDPPAVTVAGPGSLLPFYRRLLRLRAECRPLLEGSYHRCTTEDDRIFAFERRAGSERVLVTLNFSADAVPVTVGDGDLVLSTGPLPAGGRVVLGPHQGSISKVRVLP
jgi:alpha-glucosidase